MPPGESSDGSVVALCGPSVGSCGYCRSENARSVSTGASASVPGTGESETLLDRRKTSHTFGLWASALAAADYQALIDRGWRRSGCYLYKPNLQASCCPQFTIRLDAHAFVLSRSQAKIVKHAQKTLCPAPNPKPVVARETPVEQAVEPLLVEHGGPLRVELRPASFDQAVYELYCAYQTAVHHDPPEKLSPDRFTDFLVNSPLIRESASGVQYGSFHELYWLGTRLVACAVVDLLPKCLSSVYFFYDPTAADLHLGTLSALIEVAQVRRFAQQCPELHYYYMGFYIHNCTKMRYKAQFRPSELQCPFSYGWRSFDECAPLLDRERVPQLCPDAPVVSETLLETSALLRRIPVRLPGPPPEPVVLLGAVPGLLKHLDRVLRDYLALVGPDLALRLVLDFSDAA